MADTRKVTLGGKEFFVTEDMAKQLDEMEADYKTRLQSKDQELAAVKRPADSIGERIFTEPDAVLGQFEERVTGKILGELDKREKEKETKLAGAEMVAKFWSDFSREHPDLKDDLDLANQILMSKPSELLELNVKYKDNPAQERTEIIKILADLTRKRILGYIERNRTSSGGEGSPEHPFVEGGTIRVQAQKEPPKEGDKPTSLSGVIKARKAKFSGKAA